MLGLNDAIEKRAPSAPAGLGGVVEVVELVHVAAPRLIIFLDNVRHIVPRRAAEASQHLSRAPLYHCNCVCHL